MTSPQDEPVVLVHGLWLSGWAMAFLAQHLRQCGFRTHVFSYPSVRHDLRQNAAALRAFGDGIGGPVLHYVGHSLGGVVIQTMLADDPPGRRGRVVTICSPHRGSRVAASLARRRWGRHMLGRSMCDLLARPPGAAGRSSAQAIGIIKGDRPLGLGRLFFRFDVPNDGVVAVDEMNWADAADEITLPASHSGMLLSADAAARACQFLRFGHFIR